MLQIYRKFPVLQAKNIIIVGILFFRQTQKQQEKKSCSRGHDFFVISQKRTVEYVFHRNLNTLTLHVSCGLFQKTKEKGGDKIVLK